MKSKNISKWQEIIDILDNEKMNAIEMVQKLKKNGTLENIDIGKDYYNKAQLEYNSVIKHLIIMLVAKKNVPSQSEIEEKLESAFNSRDLFFKYVENIQLSKEPDFGRKDFLPLIAASIGPVCLAIQFICSNRKQIDTLTRETLKTQVEAATWSDYKNIE